VLPFQSQNKGKQDKGAHPSWFVPHKKRTESFVCVLFCRGTVCWHFFFFSAAEELRGTQIYDTIGCLP